MTKTLGSIYAFAERGRRQEVKLQLAPTWKVKGDDKRGLVTAV